MRFKLVIPRVKNVPPRRQNDAYADVVLGEMYLDVEILVNFHHLAKHEYVLHYARKLPHVSYSLEQRHLFGWLRRLHLVPAAFSGWHDEGTTRAAAWPLS